MVEKEKFARERAERAKNDDDEARPKKKQYKLVFGTGLTLQPDRANCGHTGSDIKRSDLRVW